MSQRFTMTLKEVQKKEKVRKVQKHKQLKAVWSKRDINI